YDFEIRDEDNKIYNKDFYDLNDNYCYGKEVIAPLDGVVVSIVDKFSDESMRLDRLANSSASDIRGNHIIIKHSNGEYSMLAHLLKGSILVKKNDCIKQGDVIAKCGNSGNTNGPHLHFQVSNGPSFTFNASLPIKFKGIGFINAPSNISNID
ncbi:MAG: M23 family metallopeptidase, partial [Erysipelotrichales bacterium]